MNNRTVIVGAGPSGLTVASRLGGNHIILESSGRVGGLCQSRQVGGATFDIGGHSFHTPYQEVLDFVEHNSAALLYAQTRDATVYCNGEIIPYPFQRNYHLLEKDDIKKECENGLRAVQAERDKPIPNNFLEAIQGRFGAGILNHFLLPYNKKIWRRDLRTMSVNWVPERISPPTGERQESIERARERVALAQDTKVRYPNIGGFEQIFIDIAKNINEIKFDSKVINIDLKNRNLTTAAGNSFDWDRIVWTGPIDQLVRTVSETPDPIYHLAGQLEKLSLCLTYVVVNRRLTNVPHRMYVHEPVWPFHKVVFNNTSSPTLKEEPHHGIMAESSISLIGEFQPQDIRDKFIEFLVRAKILKSVEEIICDTHEIIEYAYPVPKIGTVEIVKAIQEYFLTRNIFCLGRFGTWQYLNSDGCIRNALTLADELADN
jgi:protoporphyrinogen oxidase